MPISGTPEVRVKAPTGYKLLTGGTEVSVSGVTTLDDRNAEREIFEIVYNRAS